MTQMDDDYYAYSERFFRQLAPIYDPVTFITFQLRNTVVDFSGARKDERILDVATGTGQQAIAFARRGFEVVGVDLSADMLLRARRKNRGHTVSLVFADATEMPFVDNCFDVSTVSFALHDMPEYAREKVINEMARVTKRRGKLIVIDYDLPRESLSRHFWYAVIRSYEGKYYPRFIKTNLEATLKKYGVRIEKRISVALGTIRFIEGINEKKTPQ